MPINYSKYPPNWKTEIRPRILKRAGDCCEWCKLENGSFVWSIMTHKRTRRWLSSEELKYMPLMPRLKLKRVKVVLTIAHLDHDESNWNVKDDRLAALCQKHHLRFDAPEKKRRREKKKRLILNSNKL